MTTTKSPPDLLNRADKTLALALSLAHAEVRLHALTAGQVDAIVDPAGKTYLLRSAQEYLLQDQRRLQAMIESTADVIMVVNRAGVILSHNRAVRRVIGYEPEELVGKYLFDLLHEEDFPAVYAAFFNVMEEFQENAVARFRHRVSGGSFRTVEATLGKLRDIASASVVLTLRPIEKPLQAPPDVEHHETASVDATLAKDRFLAMLSHELRTPLMLALLGISELQLNELFAGARPVLAMIRRNLELQARLLDELTDFAGIGQREVRVRSESADAHEAISSVLQV